MTNGDNLKKVKIKNYKVIPPKKAFHSISTEPDYPALHTLCIATGKRASGKTTSICNLVAKGQKLGYFDRVMLITPTYASNKNTFSLCDINEDDIFEPTITVLQSIKDIINSEKAEWDMFELRKEQYKNFKREIKRKPITEIDEETLLDYQELDFFEGAPKWKYDKEVPPRLALIIDDAMGTDLYSKPRAGLTKFIIAHRHWGDGLGISVFMLTQSYCAIGSIARPIRENCTHLLLFKLRDENQRKKILEEIGSDVSLEKFEEMFDYATAEKHNFLFVDFNPKSPDKQFRHNFDTYLN